MSQETEQEIQHFLAARDIIDAAKDRMRAAVAENDEARITRLLLPTLGNDESEELHP